MHVARLDPRIHAERTRKGRGGSSATGEAFRLALGAAAGSPGSMPAPTTAASPVSTVLTLQEVSGDGDAPARQKAVHRGERMLDELEDLRRDLLSGTVPAGRLVRLAGLARAKPEMFADPHLKALIEEIELRAAVELAKLERR